VCIGGYLAQAVHLKLNELVAALEGASSRLINVEELTKEEVRTLHQHYQGLVALAKRETSLTHCHSIEEAEVRHRRKKRRGLASVAVTPPASHEPTGPPGGHAVIAQPCARSGTLALGILLGAVLVGEVQQAGSHFLIDLVRRRRAELRE
jgi:hypothetical protein